MAQKHKLIKRPRNGRAGCVPDAETAHGLQRWGCADDLASGPLWISSWRGFDRAPVEGISNQLLVTSFPRRRKLQVQAHEHLELRLCRTVVRDGELRLCERVDAGTSRPQPDLARTSADENGPCVPGECLDKGLDEAQSKGLIVVDMKSDWRVVFPGK